MHAQGICRFYNVRAFFSTNSVRQPISIIQNDKNNVNLLLIVIKYAYQIRPNL